MIKIIKGLDKNLLILTIILFACGLLMVYSASNVTAYMLNEATPGRYFMKQLVFIASGFFVATIVIRAKTKSYYFLSSLLLLIDSGAIVLLILYGAVVNGAQGWIGINGLGIQPSEFAKIIIIPFFAVYYDKHKKSNDSFLKMFFPMIVAGIVTLLIILQNDYGTALIFLAITVMIFLLSPASKKLKAYFILFCVFCVTILGVILFFAGDKILDSDKLARFNYNNPCANYLTTGNQLCNGYIAINGGGILGKGFGNSTQKYLYLPEAHTDFIFAIIVEELGVVGAVILFLLYFLLLIRIIVIGKKSLSVSHHLICYAISIYIFLHIAINIGGVLGLIPVTGVPLPFMSYGGSFAWSIIMATTLVQRINYETKQNLKENNA